MKLLAAILAGLLTLACASAREFKSADGAQTINAEFVRYSETRDQVTLRMPDGRNVISDAKRFSEADRQFFKEEALKEDLADAISVLVHDKIDRGTELIERLTYTYTMANYEITVKNESEHNLEDLTVKYWVLVERNQDGKTTTETFNGEGPIKKLEAESKQTIPGPVVKLVTGAIANVHSERDLHLLDKAATVGRDRAIGHRVEVIDANGQTLYAKSSATRVDKAIGLDEKEKDKK